MKQNNIVGSPYLWAQDLRMSGSEDAEIATGGPDKNGSHFRFTLVTSGCVWSCLEALQLQISLSTEFSIRGLCVLEQIPHGY